MADIAGIRSVVSGEGPYNDFFIDIYFEYVGNPLRDIGAANPGVAPHQIDGSLNEFLGGALGAGFSLRVKRIQHSVLTRFSRCVKFQ